MQQAISSLFVPSSESRSLPVLAAGAEGVFAVARIFSCARCCFPWFSHNWPYRLDYPSTRPCVCLGSG